MVGKESRISLPYKLEPVAKVERSADIPVRSNIRLEERSKNSRVAEDFSRRCGQECPRSGLLQELSEFLLLSLLTLLAPVKFLRPI